jgi:biopolymer transport protein ExbD
MRRTRSSPQSDQTEINVSPLIDMVFILLIFFIVATSFVNEVGISSTHKDSNIVKDNQKPPLSFNLNGAGQILIDGYAIGLEGVAPKVRNYSAYEPPSVIIQVSTGAKAGLAAQVMDQALIAGAKAVKLAAVSP